MCTVSVLRAPWAGASETPYAARWRVVFNRDERRSRGAGLPPVEAGYGDRRALHPVDPDGAGTWLAASSAGLVFALLNQTEGPEVALAGPAVSRGQVIPALLASRCLEEVDDRLARYPVDVHRGFRLLVIGDPGVLEAVHDGDGLRVSRHGAVSRLMRTSSSVDPAPTRRRRTALFDRLVPLPCPAAQDAFHAHRWRLAPSASVLMDRADARTVSVAVVDAFAHGFRLTYRALPAGDAGVTELVLAA